MSLPANATMTRMSFVSSSQEEQDKADQVTRFLDRLEQYRQQLLTKQVSEELMKCQPATRYIN
jgi:hypothetical protein